ncbi:hypothetical protein [Glycomyces rhizosphaerae]|uniref:Secreted protein n=1 Tax=Glycomyces rhizosphaerae TaxID=2054422 RepID=A0ABV7Q0D8_9ACTN
MTSLASSPQKPAFEPGRIVVTSVITALLTASCSSFGDALDAPPESEYTQAEAYAPMEEAVDKTVTVLPEFPGFESRWWHELPCEHNGISSADYTNIEIEYTFSTDDSATELTREQYVDVLREHWTSLGYEITRDEERQRGDRLDHDLVAEREDGISLWYTLGSYNAFLIQSGCVPVSDPSEIEYIAPVGGIEPGGDMDMVDDYFPDGIPTDQAAAIDPFAGTQATYAPVPFESPESYEGQI